MNARSPGAAYDVIVVGGGMVGGLFACALGDSGLKVAVLERYPAPTPDALESRVSAITPASRAMLEAVGAWAGVGARPYGTVRAMRVWDDAGRGAISFEAADIGEPCLAYIVENNAIVAALRQRVSRFTNIHWISPAPIVDMTVVSPVGRITLDDGRLLSTRLIVGADGADSAVRRAAGIALRRLDVAQKSIVATVETEWSHGETAYQRFLSTGPLAFLPLAERHRCSIVWSADSARADALMALDDVAFVHELGAAFGENLGGILSAHGRAIFTLGLAHAVSYVAPGVALIGDAAHTVHPLAGQGVNLGFLDAATLAEVVLDAAHKRKQLGAVHVLRRYERWRKGDNLGMVAITGGFKYLFGNSMPVLRDVRSFGLTLVDAARPIKNCFMRRACGLNGDLPKLARRAS